MKWENDKKTKYSFLYWDFIGDWEEKKKEIRNKKIFYLSFLVSFLWRVGIYGRVTEFFNCPITWHCVIYKAALAQHWTDQKKIIKQDHNAMLQHKEDSFCPANNLLLDYS